MVIEAQELTLMFRGLSDEDVDKDEEGGEISGGFDDGKRKVPGADDALPEEDVDDLDLAKEDEEEKDGTEDDGTGEM